jgi:hypothetical protein
MAEANQSLPITTRRVSEGWRSLYDPIGRADDDIPDQLALMLGDPTTSWRCSLIGRSRVTLHTGAADWIPRLRFGLGWLWLRPTSPSSITTRRVSEGRRSLYDPIGRADDDIPDQLAPMLGDSTTS